MLPDLFVIPGLNLPVHTYGVLIILGFMGALYVAHLQAQRAGFGPNDVYDFGFWALLGGIIGARIVFILVDWRLYFIEDPWVQLGSTGIHIPAVFAIWQGGLVYWGSIIGGFVAFWMYTSKRSLPRWQFADFCALGLPLAQVMGRLGCVAAGCCWGRAMYHVDEAGEVISDLPIYMQFPGGSLTYNGMLSTASGEEFSLMQTLGETLPLFPSQLAESFGSLIIFAVILAMVTRKRFHGQLLLTYVALYSVMRFGLEYFRGDTARGFVVEGVLSTSQFISLVVIVLSILAGLFMRQRSVTASKTSQVA